MRGFALARDQQFLDPYTAGRREQAVATRRLRALVAGDPVLEARVEALDAAATRWQGDGATRLIAAARSNRTDLANTALIERSKAQFDAVRNQYTRLGAALSTARRSALDEIQQARRPRSSSSAIVVIAVLVACAVVIWVGLRRLVISPIDRLGGDARRVTAGDVDHAIEPTGPKELAALGDDIEAMRRTIVDDLADRRSRARRARRAGPSSSPAPTPSSSSSRTSRRTTSRSRCARSPASASSSSSGTATSSTSGASSTSTSRSTGRSACNS